jgi:hypothetical protein
MSKMTEYISAAVDYDASGLPASTTHFTFGLSPFSISETDDLESLTQIATVCESDAVVDIEIIDNIAKVSFDFSSEMETFLELTQEILLYKEQRKHVTESIRNIMSSLDIATRNEDERAKEEAQLQLRSMNVPFMLPTIMPVCYDGDVHICFADDPKFIMFESEQINQQPCKITMIFDAYSVFCRDEVNTYMFDTDYELKSQQEELWYADLAKKAEEEAYQSQYGYSNDLYDQEDDKVDKRLKGVRFK